MPTVDLFPAAAGSLQEWDTQGPEANAWDALADNLDTTFRSTSTAGDVDLFTVGAMPAEAASVTEVAVRWRFRAQAGGVYVGQARPVWKLGGVTETGTTRTYPDDGDFSVYQDDAIARPGGGSWTLADLTTLEVGYEAIAVDPGNDQLMVARLRLIVTYALVGDPTTPPSVTLPLTRTQAVNARLGRTVSIDAPLARTARIDLYMEERR